MNVVDYLLGMRPGVSNPALFTLRGEYSYSDLCRAVDAVAGFFIATGARRGDRVLLLSENSFFWVAGYLGTLRAGCVSVPVAPSIKGADLKYIIASCAIEYGLVHNRINHEQLAAFPAGSRIVVEDGIDAAVSDDFESVEFEGLLASAGLGPVLYPVVDDERDLAAIMFTSGSTGEPRGVMVSHRNIIANTASIVDYLSLTARDRIMVVLPFYYCFGTSLLHTHLRAGGSLVIDSRFMFPDKVLLRMQATQCTGFAGVPSHYQMLLRKSSFKKMRFPALRYAQQAGGKLGDALLRELQQALPATEVFVMYGQTEATSRLSYLPPEQLDEKLGSIGKGLRGTRLRVVDDNGQSILPGQVGEIVAEGDNVTLGYWGEQGERSATFRDGLLFTGDLATVDEEGYIFIVGRSKDILKCGGNRVSCKEVEEQLLEFQGLLEAAVIGVSDEVLGEAVKAFVVPEEGTADLVERLRAYCFQRMPAHLIPREIVVVNELPKTTSGKVMKPALRSWN